MDINLSNDEALALAQFVKCLTWRDMRECAVETNKCESIGFQTRAITTRTRGRIGTAIYGSGSEHNSPAIISIPRHIHPVPVSGLTGQGHITTQ
ncbi:DUF7706 family protein [Xenorhabdus budapestensis]|uniref:DUF7706 family protein n=1 Tax=Xenorhabdus budapestensis TaxID=290110 RepID=UPI003BB53E36